jgi:predicted enzyme related to lactoylglutathione lyase
MGAPLAYFDIAGKDPARLATFYSELFDWKVTDGPEPGYSMVDTGGEVGGGIGAVQEGDAGGVTIYLRVDDLQRYLDKAAALGGATVLDPTELAGGFGSIAVLADPEGRAVGLWC